MLKSIEIIRNKKTEFINYKKFSFLDQIIIGDSFTYYTDVHHLDELYIEDFNTAEIDSNSPYFKSIGTLKFYNENIDVQINTIKRVEIKSIEMLIFNNISSKNFEEFVISENFNYKIRCIQYLNNSWVQISNDSLINISKIKFKELILPDLSTISYCIKRTLRSQLDE